MALGKIGVSKRLSNVDTDQTNEAIQCRLYFDGALDRALGELPWKFATRTATLTDIGTPPDRWGHRYRLPDDCVSARTVPFPVLGTSDAGAYYVDQVPPYLAASLIKGAPFEIVEDENGGALALCTDLENATLVYTARISSTALYPQTFIDLFCWSLAMDLAPPLATAAGLITTASQGYAATVLRVGARDLNQETPRPATAESDFITARY